jgi:hypothetical protein
MKPANKKIAEATRKATAPPAAPEAKVEVEAAKVAKAKKAPATKALQYPATKVVTKRRRSPTRSRPLPVGGSYSHKIGRSLPRR